MKDFREIYHPQLFFFGGYICSLVASFLYLFVNNISLSTTEVLKAFIMPYFSGVLLFPATMFLLALFCTFYSLGNKLLYFRKVYVAYGYLSMFAYTLLTWYFLNIKWD